MNDFEIIKEKITAADAVLITASNGLSITEGLNLFAPNKEFFELFGDFSAKYGFGNILQGCFTRFNSEAEKWAFWSRLISHYNLNYRESEVMSALKTIIGEKPYFILTSNGEAHFEKCGFNPACIYEVEGSWENMQCENACHDTLYPVLDLIAEMAENEQDGKIPDALIPHCPVCGGAMRINMASDASFIPNNIAKENFRKFINKNHGKNLVVLELGIGAANRLIKAPIMQLVASEPNFFYVTFNKGEIYIPAAIRDKSVGVDGLLTESFSELVKLF